MPRAAHCAIRKVQLREVGRLADFEKLSVAAAPALVWTGEEFQSAYRKNQASVVDETFEADIIAMAVRDYLAPRHPDRWEGTPAELQVQLEEADF